jgi:3-deoxy-7-phosphoheptulonate synthase
MIVVMNTDATEPQIQSVIDTIHRMGLGVHRSDGVTHTVLGAVGEGGACDPAALSLLDGVRQCLRITSPYKLASRPFRSEGTIVRVGSMEVGGPAIVLIAGPCSVESAAQIDRVAAAVAATGATMLRGGAFKPRSSPYSFQGLGEEGLRRLRDAADRHRLQVVSEVMEVGQVPLIAEYADLLQIGARNMQNFNLLRAVGRQRKPVLLKRGQSGTLEELLLCAEYILSAGNDQVILCERGIRTFERYTRNTMDISAIPALKQLSHLPVIADPSHGTGLRDLVAPLARAAVAAGADGLLIEVHNEPERARSDGAQSLYPHQFAELVRQVRLIARAINRTLAVPELEVCEP